MDTHSYNQSMFQELFKRMEALENKQKQGTPDDPYMDLKSTAEFCDCSKRTLERDMDKGLLKGYKQGLKWKFKLSEIRAYMESRRKP